MKKLYSNIGLLIIIDQLVKFWVEHTLPLHTTKPLMSNVLSLFHLHNTGAAWGMLAGNKLLFYAVTIVVVISLHFWILTKETSTREKIAYVLIISGALGNFIDRVRLGYVIDMFQLEFIQFPVFNVADIYLTIGVVLFLMDALHQEFFKKHNSR